MLCAEGMNTNANKQNIKHILVPFLSRILFLVCLIFILLYCGLWLHTKRNIMNFFPLYIVFFQCKRWTHLNVFNLFSTFGAICPFHLFFMFSAILAFSTFHTLFMRVQCNCLIYTIGLKPGFFSLICLFNKQYPSLSFLSSSTRTSLLMRYQKMILFLFVFVFFGFVWFGWKRKNKNPKYKKNAVFHLIEFKKKKQILVII